MDLAENDQQLLSELGLQGLLSTEEIELKIREMGMRQLDRLKLMFERINKNGDIFSEDTRRGIKNNDLRVFSEAVVILARSQMKKHN